MSDSPGKPEDFESQETVAPGEAGAAQPTPGTTPAIPERSERALFGDRSHIGQYALIREIGRGGQGLVYLAEDTKLARRVALKVIAPQFAPTGSTLARFHREAAAASRLDHPGICSVYEVGEADGVHYMSMRFIEGQTMAQMIDDQKTGTDPGAVLAPVVPSDATLPTDGSSVDASEARPTEAAKQDTTNLPTSRDLIMRVVRFVENTARALHYAHESGLIHRDIKPANIMVSTDDTPVILDFGLAREEDTAAGLTHSGDLLGTPSYMSPEQIAAQRITLDRRTDIYSLGVSLYEALTLQRPFDGHTRDAVYQKILTQDPRSPVKINRNIPWDLKIVLETAMEKDRDRRYKTALDFAEDLRRVRTFEPIHARPPGVAVRLQRWGQRNPAGATALILLSVMLIGALFLLDEVFDQKKVADDATLAAQNAVVVATDAQSKLRIEHGKVATALAAKLEKEKELSDANKRLLEEQAELQKKRLELTAALKEAEDERNKARDSDRKTQEAAAALKIAFENEQEATAKATREATARASALAKLEMARDDLEAALDSVRREKDRAQGLYLTAKASSVLGENPTQALLLAVEGAKRQEGRLANEVLLAALQKYREIRVFRGNESAITKLAVSPDGVHIAAETRDGTIRVWRHDSEDCEHWLFHPSAGALSQPVFSPDGTVLATASDDGSAYLWSVVTGSVIAVLRVEESAHHVTALAFSPGGSEIAVGLSSGAVRVWKTDDFSPIGPAVDEHECGIGMIEFSLDGSAFLTTSNGDILEVHRNGSNSWASSRGKSEATSVRVWSAETCELMAVLGPHHRDIREARFDGTGELVLTLDRRGVRGFDLTTQKELYGPDQERLFAPSSFTLGSFAGMARSVFFARDFTGRTTRRAVKNGKELSQISGASQGGRVVVSPDGNYILGRADSTGRSVGMWSVLDGTQVLSLTGHEGLVTHSTFLADGEHVVTASQDGTVRLWDARVTGGFAQVISQEEQRNAFAGILSEDGSRFVSVRSGEAKAFDTSSGETLSTMSVGTFGVKLFSVVPMNFAMFEPSTDRVLTCFVGGLLRYWSDDGKKILPAKDLARDYRAIDYSADGKRTLRHINNGPLQILDTETGAVQHVWADSEVSRPGGPRQHPVRPRPTHWVRGSGLAQFVPGTNNVLAVVANAQVKLWDPEANEEKYTVELTDHFRVTSRTANVPTFNVDMCVSPNGDEALLCNRGGSAVRIRVADGKTLGDVSGPIVRAQYSPDGDHALIADASSVRLVALKANEVVWKIGDDSQSYHNFCADADGERVVLFSSRHLLVVDRSGKELHRLESSIAPQGGAIDVSGTKLALFGRAAECEVWNLETGERALELGSHEGGVLSACFDSTGERLITVAVSGVAAVWNASDGKKLQDLRRTVFGSTNHAPTRPFSFGKQRLDSSGARMLDVPSVGSDAYVWDTTKGKQLLTIRNMTSRSGALSPDGRRVAFGGRSMTHDVDVGFLSAFDDSLARTHGIAGRNEFSVLDASSGKLVQTLDLGKLMTVLSVTFSQDSQKMFITTPGSSILFDLESGQTVFSKQLRLLEARFSPDGSMIAGIEARRLKLWSTVTGEELEFEDADVQISSFAFSADGRYLAAGGNDSTIRVWDLQSPASGARLLRGHLDLVETLCFSPDGRWLASAAGDRTMRVWRLDESREWMVVPHPSAITQITFAPSSSHVLSTCGEGRAPIVFRWPLDLLGESQRRVQRDLTPEERIRLELGSVEERQALAAPQKGQSFCRDIRLIARFLASNPDSESASSRLMKDIVPSLMEHLQTGENKSVANCVLEAFDEFGLDRPEFWWLRADLQLVAGNYRDAVLSLEYALEVQSSTPELQSKLKFAREKVWPDLVSFASIEAAVSQPDILIPEDAEWRYFKGTQKPSDGIEWVKHEFDDSSWSTGKAGFGYGDGDDRTLLEDMRNNYSTLYVRRAFQVDDPARFKSFQLRLRIDDGQITYLNGREIGRSRMGSRGAVQPHDGVALSTSLGAASESVIINVKSSDIRPGRNVIAIQGANSTKNSSDFSLIPTLVAVPKADEEADTKRFEAFRKTAKGIDAPVRTIYLDGLLLERVGKYREAASKFSELAAAMIMRPEPIEALARCARATGDSGIALVRVRQAIRSGLIHRDELWHLWWVISFVDRKESQVAALEFLRRFDGPRLAPRAKIYRDLLQKLISDRALRINCGSVEEFTGTDGRVWMKDRFYKGGLNGVHGLNQDFAGTDDDPLYRRERWFDERGNTYSIPLPVGKYEVVLHFSEAYHKRANERIFSVQIEDELVMERYDIFAELGLDRIAQKRFPVVVKDGVLSLKFQRVKGRPKINAIEIIVPKD